MTLQLDAHELHALQEALAVATRQARDAKHQGELLASELRVVRAERNLLKERLNQFMRKIFAAKSEAGGPQQQKDMFFNEAEALGCHKRASRPGRG